MDAVVIIGNGIVEKNFSGFVDSSKYVIRFNWLLNYKENTGSKINALALASAKQHMIDFCNPLSVPLKDHLDKFCDVLSQVDTLLFPIPDANRSCFERLKRIDAFISYYSLQEKTIKNYFCEDSYLKALKEYGWNEAYVAPSSGYTVTRNVLDDVAFNNFKVYLLGFNWEGWIGHPWYNEKMVIEQLAASNRLEILS